MIINDFLRMSIVVGKGLFDTVKNLRFYDNNNVLLVGQGTSSIYEFNKSFFEYVSVRFPHAIESISLIEQNKISYVRLSVSENLLLTQRILAGIANAYDIGSYRIENRFEEKNQVSKENETGSIKKQENNVQPQKIQPNNRYKNDEAVYAAMFEKNSIKNKIEYTSILNKLYPSDTKIIEYMDSLRQFYLGDKKSVRG